MLSLSPAPAVVLIVAIMSLWLSVVVKERGHVLKGPCIVRGNYHESIGSVIEGLEKGYSQRDVNRLVISKTENFSACHEVSLDTPLSVCQDFGCKYVCCFFEQSRESCANDWGQPVRNAFSVAWRTWPREGRLKL